MLMLYVLHVFLAKGELLHTHLSERRFRLMAEASSDIIGLSTLDGKRLYISPAVERVLGWRPDELRFGRVGDMWHPDDAPAAAQLFGESRDGQTACSVEYRCRKSDGSYVWLEANARTYCDGDCGQPAGFVIVERDITLRKADQQKQDQARKALLASIVEFSEDAIIGRNDQGIVISWNAAAERIFGYTADEMIGQSILRLVPGDLVDEETEFLERIKQGKAIEHIETQRKGKNGTIMHVSLAISPLRDANAKITGASTIARDLTTTRQLQQQLRKSQKMDAVGQLTGGIAHDFNNLLAVIVGNLDLAECMVSDNPIVSKRLQTAQKAAARGADLTRRLLAFSSRDEFKPVPTILADSIRNTIELATGTLGSKIKITAKLDESLPAVFVDPAGLENALLNLVVNARDAMPEGGSLTITCQLTHVKEDYSSVKVGELKPGRYASVSITDTGIGMPRETLERAFEPFFTTKPRDKGTGLGLAMVYGFVKQSGGTVHLSSEIGFGTTVTIYLQLAQGGASAPEEVVEQRAANPSRGKVLVVDDEVDLLNIAYGYLEEMGYTVFRATDGASALKIIERERDIDLVVTDVIMPGGLNGAELVQRIRQLLPEIKTIYSSRFPDSAVAERIGNEVDALLLRKPYQRAEFDSIVRRTFNGAATATGG
jgi:PAS domain S-box-containing protein